MASIHTRKKRSARDAGEGVPALGGRRRCAPTSRGTFCRVLPYGRSPDPLPTPAVNRAPFPGPRGCTSWGHPCPWGPPGGGALCGVFPRGRLENEQRQSAPGPRGSSPAHRAAHWHSAHTAGRGALRVKQGRATRRLGLPAPRAAFRGLRRPPTARPALHAGETDEKIKNPR